MTDIPTIETDRLRLRPHRIEDFDAYTQMWADPQVLRFMGGGILTREQSWSRFLRQIGVWHCLGFGFFALEDKQTGTFAGECGFHDLHRDVVPSIEGTMEAGWALVPAMQGKGLAEEAMRAALGWAAAHGTGDRLTAIVNPANAASLRVAAKLGFHRFAEGTYNGKIAVLLERPRRIAAGQQVDSIGAPT